MATLSGNSIQNTYDGLLKLDDSTSGITTSFQDITDGLGNPTGLKIKENFFQSPNMFSQEQFKYQYYGSGWQEFGVFVPSQSLYGGSTRKAFQYAVDLGYYSYSAITLHLSVNTINNELMQLCFYDAQLVPSIGLLPKNKLTDVITLNNTGATGQQTYIFSTPLTLQPGFYFVVWTAFNNTSPNSALTSRYRSSQSSNGVLTLMDTLGKTQDDNAPFGGSAFLNGFGSRNALTMSYPIYDNVGYASSYSSASLISGRLGAQPLTSAPGFILHTIF